MPIISFGWTAQLLPPRGCKDTTRRLWSDRTVAMWQKAWDTNPDKLHAAWDKSPFVNGSQQVGSIQLIERPFLEKLHHMGDDEITREGHPELSRDEFIDKYFWKPKKSWDTEQDYAEYSKLMQTEFCVIRFNYIPLNENP